jgi:type VI secretion system protein ImpK
LANIAAGPGTEHTLMDLMNDEFYALFMLNNGNGPQANTDFINKITQFLDDFSRGAKKQGASADDIDNAKYAFCAAVDEIILRSPYGIRDAWERRPLQLVLFGDQLAGENFFNRLESLRARGSVHLQALEVFHMCLLLSFQGRYIIEGSEKTRRRPGALPAAAGTRIGAARTTTRQLYFPGQERSGPDHRIAGRLRAGAL